ncbi:hypothetical protein GGI15_004681 [Coemansia interrupta]|uniref:Uncharacterized protein n=1 Tax=Coemansia interrupta TaxID=1126814 RepID=A0A9W8H6F6_9FUNG|nr:hypothetical protein GGI15_004681 [Coemansia interrupta]
MHLLKSRVAACIVVGIASLVVGQRQPQNMNTGFSQFTPIRLIQAQDPEQQRTIQSLVQELQKSSPQLFSNIGQNGGQQQLALAVPSPLVGNNQAPAPAPQSIPQQFQSQIVAPSPAPAIAPAPVPTPQAPPAPVPAPVPISASMSTTANSGVGASQATPLASGTDLPLNFVVNGMSAVDTVGELPADSLPFGLHFDATHSSLEDDEDESGAMWSDSHGHHASHGNGKSSKGPHTAHRSRSGTGSSDDEIDGMSDNYDDLSGLDSSATKTAMSLVAIGLSLLGVFAA